MPVGAPVCELIWCSWLGILSKALESNKIWFPFENWKLGSLTCLFDPDVSVFILVPWFFTVALYMTIELLFSTEKRCGWFPPCDRGAPLLMAFR